MTQNKHTSNLKKNPNNWKSGNEQITDAQKSYLHTLADMAGEKVNDKLSKSEAAKEIERLQQKTGRKTW